MGSLSIIILAGGISSRFWPLQEKNTYPFLGKTNIDRHIKRFEKLKNTKIYIVTNERVSFQNKKATELVQVGMGMAGSVLTALEKTDDDDEILVLNGNDFYNESLNLDFINARDELKRKNQALIVGYKTESYFPGGYLETNGDYITGIIEKPGEGNTPSDYVNIVFHYFPNALDLKNALKNAKSDKDDLYEVALDSLMESGLKFKLLKYTSTWKTVKYPWHVLDVMEYFLDKIKGQNISKNAQVASGALIKGDVIIEDGVKIFDGAVINGPCFIGRNTIIANGALVRHSMIGENCVIGFATEVARSYFKSNVWLHKNYVGDSIYDQNVSMGSNAITGNLRLDEQNIKKVIKGVKINTNRNKLGAIIGPDVRIGVNVNTMPGVSIGSNCFIGPNVNVEEDLEDGKFVKLVQTLKVKDNNFDIKTTNRDNIKKNL